MEQDRERDLACGIEGCKRSTSHPPVEGQEIMRFINEECDCVICGNEADLVIECNLLDTRDPDNIKILPKDPDVQVMPGV